MVTGFTYHKPVNTVELCELLDHYGAAGKLLAGGTDLIVDMRSGLRKFEHIIDIKNIPELNEIKYSKQNGLSIGAAVTCNQLVENKTAHKKYKLLCDCAEAIASYPLRNRATVVGNIVNASPCADTAPGLLCLDAEVVINSSAGSRKIKLKDFFEGVKKVKLAQNEFVSELIIPASSADSKGAYMKQKRIKGHDLSIVSVAMAVNKNITVAVGSAFITPVALPSFPKKTKVEVIIDAVMKAVKPISDIRSSKEYRLHIIKVYIKRLYEKLT